jgi:protein gp37
MSKTKIEWTDAVWNPVTGCTKVSEGCKNCYAERMSKRLAGRCGYPKDNPFKVTLHPEKLDEPLKWKKPRKIFVNSMSDLFHDDVPFEFIRAVWARMATIRQHTYMVLTKRPKRMLEFFEWMDKQDWRVETLRDHIWLGVSAENQATADERIPFLLEAPVGVRFVSAEPLLGPINITNIDAEKAGHDEMYFINALTGKHTDMGRPCKYLNKLDWVIVGGESGPGARPMHPDWVRSMRDQCQAANVPFFFKQWGEWLPNAHEYDCNPGGVNYKQRHQLVEDVAMCRVGKKRSGRKIDGRTWDEFPEIGGIKP